MPFGPVAEIVDPADVVGRNTLAGGAVDPAAEKPEFVIFDDFRRCPLGISMFCPLKSAGDTVINDASDKGGFAFFVERGEFFSGLRNQSFVKREKLNAQSFKDFINSVKSSCGTAAGNDQIISDSFKLPFFFTKF
jgi:hypothetical protein